jgi:formylglycine-generating enzyme required for sulfatase activity
MHRFLIGVTLSLGLAACASGPTTTAMNPGTAFRDCADCPEMVAIAPGSFTMGSDHIEAMRGNEMRPEGPIRQVNIAKPFAAGKYEVTNKEFGAFVTATGYKPAAACQIWGGVDVVPGKTWRDPDYGRPPRESEPVVCVTWLDAKAYAAWLSKTTGKTYRLLTEAEWEYTAKAGSKTIWPWGEDAQRICEFGNAFDKVGRADPRQTNDGGATGAAQAECSDGYAIVAPVGQFKPNAFGVYDTIGNVWEWTEDCSAPGLYPDKPLDGSAVQMAGQCDKRAVRSASWRTRLSRHRPTFRGRDPEPTASNIFGFRIGRDLE